MDMMGPIAGIKAILLLVSKHGSKNKNNRATKIDEYLDKHALY